MKLDVEDIDIGGIVERVVEGLTTPSQQPKLAVINLPQSGLNYLKNISSNDPAIITELEDDLLYVRKF